MLLHVILAALFLIVAFRAIGRRPFVILYRRLSGELPRRPFGAEPGPERWMRLGGIVGALGVVMAVLVGKPVGYPILACGFGMFGYAGVRIALNRNGEAERAVQRFWTDQGLSVPMPVLQARAIGAGTALIGFVAGIGLLAAAFR